MKNTVQVQHFDRIGRRTHLRTIPVRKDGSFIVQGCGCRQFQVIYSSQGPRILRPVVVVAGK